MPCIWNGNIDIILSEILNGPNFEIMQKRRYVSGRQKLCVNWGSIIGGLLKDDEHDKTEDTADAVASPEADVRFV